MKFTSSCAAFRTCGIDREKKQVKTETIKAKWIAQSIILSNHLLYYGNIISRGTINFSRTGILGRNVFNENPYMFNDFSYNFELLIYIIYEIKIATNPCLLSEIFIKKSAINSSVSERILIE
uniref:Uncharacterized protein n=1 Tax=Onchocerca volvulus TaxID=6282 RepID=A0A8R1Y0U4_ONCVO